jgi:hypothetical protein
MVTYLLFPDYLNILLFSNCLHSSSPDLFKFIYPLYFLAKTFSLHSCRWFFPTGTGSLCCNQDSFGTSRCRAYAVTFFKIITPFILSVWVIYVSLYINSSMFVNPLMLLFYQTLYSRSAVWYQTTILNAYSQPLHGSSSLLDHILRIVTPFHSVDWPPPYPVWIIACWLVTTSTTPSHLAVKYTQGSPWL